MRFDHTGGRLSTADGGQLRRFEIAGADGVFRPADARIRGDSVVLANPNIQDPVQARMAWHEGAAPNLVNAVGLPASPFLIGVR